MKELPSFLIRQGRYEEALAPARAMTRSAYPTSRAVGHALAGRALQALHRPSEAWRELDLAERELRTIPRSTPPLDPSRSTVERYVNDLREAYARDSHV